MRRTIQTFVLPALWAFSASAFAQYDADLERPQSGAPNPEGRPPTFRAWAPLSYYLWHDAGGWHLRSTTSGHFHQFQGQVQAPEGVYNVRSTDPHTPLQILGNAISFNYSVQGGERGFDWSGSGPMIFNLQIDGRDRPEKVRIGYGEERPYPGGVQLYPGGGAGAPEAMAAPPPEDDTAGMETADGPEMDETAFHDVLSPYGQWVGDPEYGTVWRPNEQVVGPDFVPYTNGHWVYTELGWSWESAYAWGWAPFHYGNWVWSEGGYWGWVPGRVWAPAWVSWRYGGGYVGWAPIAPYGHRVVVEPRHYSYVEVGGFQSGGNYRRDVIVTGPRAERIHGQTSELASASYVGGHAVVPVHAGPSPTVIGHASGHAVVPVQSSSLHTVSPPASQHGVHYSGGASAGHPFAARPMPQAEAKQYVASQPKAAQSAFHEHVAATRGGVQPGHALPTTPAHIAPAATNARPAMNERPATMNQRPASNERPAMQNERPSTMSQRPATNERPAMNERPAANEHESYGAQHGEGSAQGVHPAAKPAPPPPPPAKPKQQEKKH